MRYWLGLMSVLVVWSAVGCGNGGAEACEADRDCDDSNECTVDRCDQATQRCNHTAAQDGTPCDGGECRAGLCEPLGPVHPCTEQGIRGAVAEGGGPHHFACDSQTTVGTLAEIEIDKDVILDGDGNLTIDGNDIHRVFSVSAGVEAELRRLIVSGGGASGDSPSGGGIRNLGVLTLTDCMVSENASEYFGGGIFNEGTLTLTNTTVSANTSTYDGGGIHNYGSTSTLTLTNSTVSGNTTREFSHAGGISNSGTATITESTVSENEAERGGGIDNAGTLILTNSTVSGNTARGEGGGIRDSGGTMTLIGTTVSGNTAGFDGGGIWNYRSATLTNSTVSQNAAGGLGGGIFNGVLTGTLTLTNTTVADNEAGFDVDGIYNGAVATLTSTLIQGQCNLALVTSLGGNIESPGNTCRLSPPSDLVKVSPQELLLGPLQDNGGPTLTHAPLQDSVAIGFSEDCAVSTDQRGVERPQPPGGDCDTGAVEVADGAGGTGGTGGSGGTTGTRALIPMACRDSYAQALHDLVVDATVDPTPIESGQSFTADIETALVLTEEFLQATLIEGFPDVTPKAIQLREAEAQWNTTGVSEGSPVSTAVSRGINLPIPQVANPGDEGGLTCTLDAECPLAAFGQTCGVATPGTCDPACLPGATPQDCANVVTGPVAIPLETIIGASYTAAATGQVCFDIGGTVPDTTSQFEPIVDTGIRGVIFLLFGLDCTGGTVNDNDTPGNPGDDFIDPNPQSEPPIICFDIAEGGP